MKRNDFLKNALLALPLASAVAACKKDGVAPDTATASPRAVSGFKMDALKIRYSEKIVLDAITPIDFKLIGADTGNELSVFISTNNNKGFGPPLHVHNSFDEFFCVIDGDFIFQLENEKFTVKPGETVYVPRKARHTFDCVSAKPGTLLVGILPAKNIEEFFVGIGKILTGKGAPDTDALVALYKKFDSELVGPPIR